MPMYDSPMPVSATNPKIVHNGETYNLVLGTATFARVGEDGNIVILPLFGGDEFFGEVLEGHWKKGWDAGMDADQAFTAIIDGSGILEFEGEADAAGVWGYGWINSQHPLPLMNEVEIQVSMQTPVDDTGAVANRDIGFSFYLKQDKDVINPSTDNNYIRILYDIDESGLLLYLQKKIGGATTTLFDGSTYDDATGRATGDLEGTIWRIVIHDGVAGAAAPENVRHMHVYLKQSDTIANAESATENELTTSPYDISDLAYNVAYPAFRIGSMNTTYYDAGNEAKTTYVKVSYPNHTLRYDFVDADYGKGDVQLWDGDPAVATSQRVFDEDHVFVNDPYLQNGLVRLHLDIGVQNGNQLWYWNGAAWIQRETTFDFWYRTLGSRVAYPFIKSIESISPEKVTINLRMEDSATQDADQFLDYQATIERGTLFFEFTLQTVSPVDDLEFTLITSPSERFGYAGDGEIGDDDLGLDGLNATLTDNFMVHVDNDGSPSIIVTSSNKKPTAGVARYRTFDGRYAQIQDFDSLDISSIKIWVGIIPFALVANLFKEAEDATLAGGATVEADGAASGGQAVLLNAQNEQVTYTVTAGTHLPEGRYFLFFRLRDTNQEENDPRILAYNLTDAQQRGEENAIVPLTLTAAYAYYGIVFDITADDVSGTDVIQLQIYKSLAAANSIYVDYFLVVPIGDGESWPQDLAHAAMRDKDQPRRLYER